MNRKFAVKIAVSEPCRGTALSRLGPVFEPTDTWIELEGSLQSRNSAIQPLSLGPILGHTTPESVKVWGRSKTGREVGRIRVVRIADNQEVLQRAVSFERETDFTAVATIESLEPKTEYRIEMGSTLSGEGPVQDWSGASKCKVATPARDLRNLTMVVGSCRFLATFKWFSLFAKLGDRTFRSIVEQHAEDPLDLILMIGDQIYADGIKGFPKARRLEEFFRCYRAAFGQPYIRELMSKVPTYLTLDDHEVENDLDGSLPKGKETLRNACQALWAYQFSHSPVTSVAHDDNPSGRDRWWYHFESGPCDFFVADTRLERCVRDDGERQIVSEEQMRAIKEWLVKPVAGQGRLLKVLVTAVPLFPDYKSGDSEDKWSGFPRQRRELIDFIFEKGPATTLVLSGDVHCSVSCSLENEDRTRQIISVVSSPFLAIPPSPKKFVTEGEFCDGYRLVPGTKRIARNNYARLKITPLRIRVEYFSRKGKRYAEAIWDRKDIVD